MKIFYDINQPTNKTQQFTILKTMTPPGVAPSQVGWCDIRGRKLLPQQPQHGTRLEKVNFKKNIWNRYDKCQGWPQPKDFLQPHD